MHYKQENFVGPTTHILSNLKYQTNSNNTWKHGKWLQL